MRSKSLFGSGLAGLGVHYFGVEVGDIVAIAETGLRLKYEEE